MWLAAFRLIWLAGLSTSPESLSQAKTRARRAAQRLLELAQIEGRVLVIGHGIMNQLIANELRRRGWHGPKRPARGHCQGSQYERAEERGDGSVEASPDTARSAP
jgi:broad specificity phosphatase PhoE